MKKLILALSIGAAVFNTSAHAGKLDNSIRCAEIVKKLETRHPVIHYNKKDDACYYTETDTDYNPTSSATTFLHDAVENNLIAVYTLTPNSDGKIEVTGSVLVPGHPFFKDKNKSGEYSFYFVEKKMTE